MQQRRAGRSAPTNDERGEERKNSRIRISIETRNEEKKHKEAKEKCLLPFRPKPNISALTVAVSQ